MGGHVGTSDLRESWGERERLSDPQGQGSRKLRRARDPEGRAREGKPAERAECRHTL